LGIRGAKIGDWGSTKKLRKLVTDNSLLRAAQSGLAGKDWGAKTGPGESVFRCARENLTEYCLLGGDVRVDLPRGTVKLYAENGDRKTRTEVIRPHPRRWDDWVMANITNVTISSRAEKVQAPRCQKVHLVPAVVVSAGGELLSVRDGVYKTQRKTCRW
jgi:hypothetical protein